MPFQDSGGYIYRPGATPNTRLLNTQRVKIYSRNSDGQFTQMGLLQTWNPTESRPIEPHRGIGWGDQIAELGVGVTDITATVTVMMMYLKGIMEVFGYKAGASGAVRSLKHHCWPFDVREDILIPTFLGNETIAGSQDTGDIFAGETGNIKVIRTFYVGCWMNDYNKSFNVGETAVAQDCTITITDVHNGASDDQVDWVANGNKSEIFQETASNAAG